jgi:hypothetical protein
MQKRLLGAGMDDERSRLDLASLSHWVGIGQERNQDC